MSKSAVNGVSRVGSRSKVLKELQSELEEVVLDPDLWLKTPHAMLGGKEPLEVACSGPRGKEVVHNLIGMIKSGAFT